MTGIKEEIMTENKQSYFKQYFLYQMGQLKACTIFSIIFSALGFPVLCFANPMLEHSSMFDEISVPLAVVGAIGVFGVCAISFIAPIIALRHLFTKNLADNILSLPLKTNQRFFADLAAIFTCVHLPYGISAAISCLVEKFSCDYHLIAGRISEEPKMYKYALAGIALLLLFCAFNVAITTCCGRLTEAIIYPVVINIVMPLAVIFGTLLSYVRCFGQPSEVLDYVFYSFLNTTSPVGAFIMAAQNIEYDNGLTVSLTAGLIMSVIYLIPAFFGYKFRRAENIGKPFVFRHAYTVFSSLIAITVVILYTFISLESGSTSGIVSISSLVLGVFLLILMLILEIINSKRVRSVGKFALRYTATMGAGILVCTLLVMSKGFGASYYVPDIDDVVNASVSYTYNYSPENYDESQGYPAIMQSHIYTTDEEAIQLILDEHEYIVKNYESKPEDSTWGYITYTMKNGRTISRVYNNDTGTGDFWANMFSTEAYRVSALKTYEQNYEKYHYDYRNSQFVFANAQSGEEYLSVTANPFKIGLIEALEKDLRADTEYGRHDEFPVGVLQLGYNYERFDDITSSFVINFLSCNEINVYESYTNTLKILSEYGKIPTAAESFEDSTKNCKLFTITRTKIYNSGKAFNYAANGSDHETVIITEEEFRELVQKQVNYHTANHDGYIYMVYRGFWVSMYNEYPDSEYIRALNEIGIEYDNYDFLSDANLYGGLNRYDSGYLNEMYNSEYAELFTDRTIFTLDY